MKNVCWFPILSFSNLLLGSQKRKETQEESTIYEGQVETWVSLFERTRHDDDTWRVKVGDMEQTFEPEFLYQMARQELSLRV